MIAHSPENKTSPEKTESPAKAAAPAEPTVDAAVPAGDKPVVETTTTENKNPADPTQAKSTV